MKVWFTSDSHFYHANIIKYCNRPWNSGLDENGNMIVTQDNVQQMNDDLVKRWNSVVSNDDIVWHLGDFALCKKEQIIDLVKQLHGRINLVLGNHDHHKYKHYLGCGFNRVYDRSVIVHEFIVLTHAPLMWVQPPMFNIFGHVHDNKNIKTFSERGCCVCVERWNYTPVDLDLIKKIAETKDFDKYNK